MRPTTNPVVTLRIIQMNLSPTKMSKEGSSHRGQITRLHNSSRHPRKAAKSAPSSMDQQLTKKRVPRVVLQGPQVTSHKDQPLQHLQHGLEDHHRLPQSLNQVQASRIHWNAMTPIDRLGFTVPTYVVGIWVIIYYRQVFLPLGFAWLCERCYRILLIGCLHLSLGCDTWFTISYANTLVSSDDY